MNNALKEPLKLFFCDAILLDPHSHFPIEGSVKDGVHAISIKLAYNGITLVYFVTAIPLKHTKAGSRVDNEVVAT